MVQRQSVKIQDLKDSLQQRPGCQGIRIWELLNENQWPQINECSIVFCFLFFFFPMNGELQESGLTEIIPLMSFSALWGQHPVFPHPESPQGTRSCWLDFLQHSFFIGEAGILPEPQVLIPLWPIMQMWGSQKTCPGAGGVSSCPPISHSLNCPSPPLKLPPQSSPLPLLLESESSP